MDNRTRSTERKLVDREDPRVAVQATRVLGSYVSRGCCGLDPKVDKEIHLITHDLCRLYRQSQTKKSCFGELESTLLESSALAMINPREDLCTPAEFPEIIDATTLPARNSKRSGVAEIAMMTIAHPRGPSLHPATTTSSVSLVTFLNKKATTRSRRGKEPILTQPPPTLKKRKKTTYERQHISELFLPLTFSFVPSVIHQDVSNGGK